MTPFRAFSLVLFGLAGMTAFGRQPAQFVVISDIHFNPLADPSLATQLVTAPPNQWETILNSNPHPITRAYGEDTTWPLFASIVAEVSQLQPQPGLIITSGDNLPHKFQEQFVSIFKNGDQAQYRQFVQKAVAFVALELTKAARGAPVVFALGNNDSVCGDYKLEPNGPFLHDSADAVRQLSHLDSAAMESWITYGDYALKNPIAPHHRILSVDSAFWSSRYKNACGSSLQMNADPGQAVISWLSKQLQDAKQKGDKVWLVYHIPPGMDGHSSYRNHAAVPLWQPNFLTSFEQLTEQYRSTIEINLAGHTHLDDFRLLGAGPAKTLVLINPGLSPNIGQNPAFRVFTLNRKGEPATAFTYFLPDLNALKWRLEYDTKSTLQFKRLDAENYAAFYRRLGAAGSDSGDWRKYYSVSRPQALNSSPAYWRSLYCATGHTDSASFEDCVKSQAAQ